MSDPAGLPRHELPLRVYYEDTDAGGIVYHANYLKFAERGRTEFLRALVGVDHRTLLAKHGLLFAVRRCTVDYLAPARLDDLLTIVTEPVLVRGARLELRQTVERAGLPLVRLEVTLAVLDRELRPRRLPTVLAARLAGCRQADLPVLVVHPSD